LRQLKMSSACPEEVGNELETRGHLSASHLYSIWPSSLLTENALFEANPEV
jgi:hypothetical protein